MKFNTTKHKKWLRVGPLLAGLGVTSVVVFRPETRMWATGVLEVILGVMIFLTAVVLSIETERFEDSDSVFLTLVPGASDWESLGLIHYLIIPVYLVLGLVLLFALLMLVETLL